LVFVFVSAIFGPARHEQTVIPKKGDGNAQFPAAA
jgi:hypothetical protein